MPSDSGGECAIARHYLQLKSYCTWLCPTFVTYIWSSVTNSSYVSGVWLGRNVSSGQYEVDLVSLFARPPSKLSIIPDSLNFDSKKLRNHNFSVSQPPPSWLDFITRSFQPSVWSQSLSGHSGSDCIWRKGRQQWYVSKKYVDNYMIVMVGW